MEETKSISLLNNATKILAEVQTIDDAKNLMDMASAAKHYARKHGLGKEAVNFAKSIEISAEIKLGEILLVMEKNKGGNPHLQPIEHDDRLKTPTYKELGITLDLASEAQSLASLPEEDQEKVKSGVTSKKTATSKLRQTVGREERTATMPKGMFNIILADPPWKYDNSGISGAAQKHYPVMDATEICNMIIPSDENSVLFLWVTNPFLVEGLRVCEAWGFTYKTNIVWIKEKAGQGFYVKGQHELLFICTKGSFLPSSNLYIRSVVGSKREEHSKKPNIFYEIIEQLYPQGKYLEIFARKARTGWTTYGNGPLL